MKWLVDTHIHIPRNDIKRDLLKRLKRELTFNNPEYITRVRMNKSTWNVTEKIEAYKITNDELIIPRGCNRIIKEIFGTVKYDDCRSAGVPLPAAPKLPFKLRDYQDKAARQMKRKHQGVLIIPCGGGKTAVAVDAIRRLETTTIVMVHTLDLLSQWKEVLKTTGLEAGEIGNSKFEIKPVTIATVQTLSKILNKLANEWFEQWGCVIQDECLIDNTLVPMADGTLKMIKEIQINDQVVTLNPITLRTGTGSVTKIHKSITTDLIRIRTGQSIIECTPTHRLWVYRDGKLIKIISNDIQPDDYLPAPRQLPHNIRRANNTVEDAVLRFYAAVSMCGHVCKDGNAIKIEVSKDREWYEKIVEDFAKLRRVKKYVAKITCRGTLLLRITDPDIKRELISKAGIIAGKKSKVITIPNWIFRLPLRQIAIFLSTCFSCEGDISDKVLNIGVCSSDFIKRLQLLLLKFGIGSNYMKIDRTKKPNHNNMYRCTIAGENLARFESLIGLDLPRKQILLLQAIQTSCASGEMMPLMSKVLKAGEELGITTHDLSHKYKIAADKRGKSITRITINRLLDLGTGKSQVVDEIEKLSKIRLLKILNIQRIKVENTPVFDLTVENDHTFCANGIFTSNCHRAPAKTFYRVVSRFPAKYRFGLTATPEREDGLTPLLYFLFGDSIYEINRKTLVERGYLTAVAVQPIFTDFNYPYYGPNDRNAMLDTLVNDADRNRHIAADVAGAVEDGHTCLVLTGRVEHAEMLTAKIQQLGIQAEVLLGKVKKSDRDIIRRKMLDGELKVIVATSVADEGLDLPNLSAVFFTFPSSALARILQRSGRVMRPVPGKPEPVIFDYVDANIRTLKQQYYQRRRAYHLLRATILEPKTVIDGFNRGH